MSLPDNRILTIVAALPPPPPYPWPAIRWTIHSVSRSGQAFIVVWQYEPDWIALARQRLANP
jgi:hypothetical protein